MRSTIAALAIVAGASTVMADTVVLDYKGQNGRTVTVQGRGSVAAGYMNFEVLTGGSSTQFAAGDRIRTFCIDLTRTLIDPDTYEIKSLDQVVPAISSTEQEALAKMFAYAVSTGLDLNNNENGANFQLAIWEVLSDLDDSGVLDVTNGNFKLSSTQGYQGDSTLLSDLFDAALNGTINPNIMLHGLDALSGDTAGQDQMYFTVIPLPTSAGLAAVGLSGVLLAGRRRFV